MVYYVMMELEFRYLAKRLPGGYKNCKKKEILDIYLPTTSRHPILRVRKDGNRFEITKKSPVNKGDSSVQLEQTIPLTPEEFAAFEKINGKRVRKIRYYYPHDGLTAQIDVFQDDLAGLVLIDFEFKSEDQKNSFEKPDFCLTDVTNEEFIAGGMVCGKKYSDLQAKLDKFEYEKIKLA